MINQRRNRGQPRVAAELVGGVLAESVCEGTVGLGVLSMDLPVSCPDARGLTAWVESSWLLHQIRGAVAAITSPRAVENLVCATLGSNHGPTMTGHRSRRLSGMLACRRPSLPPRDVFVPTLMPASRKRRFRDPFPRQHGGKKRECKDARSVFPRNSDRRSTKPQNPPATSGNQFLGDSAAASAGYAGCSENGQLPRRWSSGIAVRLAPAGSRLLSDHRSWKDRGFLRHERDTRVVRKTAPTSGGEIESNVGDEVGHTTKATCGFG